MDALLLRLLFAVSGATAGVAVAGTLPALFRLGPVSSGARVLVLAAGACGFGALLFAVAHVGMRGAAPALTAARRRVLVAALALFVPVGGALASVLAGVTLPPPARLPLAGMAGLLFVVFGAEAAIIVELMRSAIPRTARWSDGQHFIALGVVWALLFVGGGLLLARAWRTHVF